MDPDRKISPTEKILWDVADLQALGMGSRTFLWNLQREDATFPAPICIRGLRRWRPDDVRAWLARQ